MKPYLMDLNLMNPIRIGLVIGSTLLSLTAHAVLPIESWTAKSGAKVVFVASPSIPMLDINLDFDAGSRFDPANKTGVASLTAGLLEHGTLAKDGKPGLNEAQIADQFASTGGQFSAAASGDRTTVQMRMLTSTPERANTLALAAQLIQHPAWPEAVLGREKQRVIAGIKESATKPEYITSKAFSTAIYGTHPYGRSTTEQSIRGINRADLQQFYAAHYDAKHAVVTLIGAISRAEAESIAEQLTTNLPKQNKVSTLPTVEPLTASKIIRLPHPATQAHIMIGQPAVARSTPDYFPLLVGNYILGGGGFVSRLMQEVRVKRGLVYGVYSGFSPAMQPGPFVISLQTKKSQADEALQVVRDTFARFMQTGPTEAELTAAKANLMNGFVLRIDNNRKLLDNLANMAWYGLPLDYLDTWTAQINKVTRSDIQAAFQRNLQPEKMVTVIVGAEAQSAK